MKHDEGDEQRKKDNILKIYTNDKTISIKTYFIEREKRFS